MYRFNNPINFQYFNIDPVRPEIFSFNDVIVPIIRAPNSGLYCIDQILQFRLLFNKLNILFCKKKKKSILSEYFYSIPSCRAQKTEINQSGFIFTTVAPYSPNDFFTLYYPKGLETVVLQLLCFYNKFCLLN